MSLEELEKKLQRPELINANQLRIYRKLRAKLRAEVKQLIAKQKSNPQLSLKLK